MSPLRFLPDSAQRDARAVLHIASHSVPDLVREYGAPLYLFDRATIINACRRYLRTFREQYSASPVKVVYAAKAYRAPAIARLVAEQGLGLDVVSGGELMVARQAGVPMAGAYCIPMASNYNRVPRPAVILVDEQHVQLIERRETYDDLLTRYPAF